MTDLCSNVRTNVIFLEPFYSGSHKQLVDLLHTSLPLHSPCLHTLPGKKWHWRARTAALWFSQNLPVVSSPTDTTLFSSSVLSLSELLGLRPDLVQTRRVVYFHENQLAYPRQKVIERDFQYGYNEILTALSAHILLFNSEWNMKSFLNGISRHLAMVPGAAERAKFSREIVQQIQPKCLVVFFPVSLPDHIAPIPKSGPLRILWPHRWEHDKNPEGFFQVMIRLKNAGANFRLSVLGERFSQIPVVFNECKPCLSDLIDHWGYLADKREYYDVLCRSDIVVSTATHEFFGVAMVEATQCGCFPLAPNRLAYPELFPSECLYETDDELFRRMEEFCHNPSALRSRNRVDVFRFSWEELRGRFMDVFSIDDKPTDLPT